MHNDTPPKILIRTPNWLGDLVIATGFVKAILDVYPHSQVDLIVKSGFESLPLPSRGKIIVFDPEKNNAGSFGKKLKSENYSHFYVLPPSFSSAWMAFKAKIPERTGYATEFRSILLSNAKKYTRKHRSIHILKEYLNLIDPSLSEEEYPPCLEIDSNWIDQHLKNFKNLLPKSYIAFTPGAVYGPAKQWPIEYFRSLAIKMLKIFEIPIIVLGTEQDFDLGIKISTGFEEIHNYCGKTSITEFLAILSEAKLLIGNDSGSMHLMAAIERPQISFFGSTSPTWTAPINPNSRILSLNLFCSPCFAKTCRYGHYECLNKIKPEQVLDEAKKILTIVK